MGTLERKWGPFGDPKTEKGPHGDPGPQMGTHLGAVPTLRIGPSSCSSLSVTSLNKKILIRGAASERGLSSFRKYHDGLQLLCSVEKLGFIEESYNVF